MSRTGFGLRATAPRPALVATRGIARPGRRRGVVRAEVTGETEPVALKQGILTAV
ncbi:MAG: hypothetical protein V2I65_09765 [Paracoccaceae bacterium]|jgi:hypothetical protein|nr:hypothetical protein [Paracoccaceae bacterium]